MNMWLVGAGYWGSKLSAGLEKLGVQGRIIDIRNGQTINDITDTMPVILATPLWQHHDQTVALLDRGHDVYVEKPMAKTAAEVLNIQSHTKPGQLVMVGHIFIHHPQMAVIKQLIAQNSIGRVKHITSRRLNWGIYQTKTTPSLSLAAHDISIVNELAQAQCYVTSARSCNFSNNLVEDRVQFDGNAGSITFDIDVSWYWPVRTRETVIIGTHGQIVWNQDSNSIALCKNTVVNNRAVAATPVIINYHSDQSPLEHELRHWVECVQKRQQPKTGIQSALQVAEVIDQVQKLI